MHKVSKLSNGATLVTKQILGSESATVLVLVGAGSRYEDKTNNGISHFLEHIFFKGGKKYRNAKEVAQAVDEVGGEFNAFTGKEYAGYYVKVALPNIERAYDVLSDMLIFSSFSEEDVERERGVIIQEYQMYQDTPIYQVGWDFENAIFGDQPIGWDQIGKMDFLNTVKQADLLNYRAKLYTPENIVISVAGNLDHEKVKQDLEKYFLFADTKKEIEWQEFDTALPIQKVKIHNKKTEQGHLILGFRGVDMLSERRFEQKVLAALLGGSMSSRMFLEVREKLGICYSIRTSTDTYYDTGTISTYAGVPPVRIEEAISAILHEYKRILTEEIADEEIQKIKQYLKGKLVLGLEDSEEIAHSLGSQQLLKKEILTPDEIKQKIDAVTKEQIVNFAKDYFKTENICLSLIGPFEGKEKDFEKLLLI